MTKALNDGSDAKGKRFMPPLLRSGALVSIGFVLALLVMAMPGLVSAHTNGDPDAVLAITVMPVGGDSTKLNVSWTNADGNEGYKVQWKLASDSAYSTTGNSHTTAMDVTSYQISGLTADTAYDIKVSTNVLTNCEEAPVLENWSGSTPANVIADLSVQAVDDSPSQLDVSWSKANDNNVIGYMVQWKLSGMLTIVLLPILT